jgi:hypothetical protein
MPVINDDFGIVPLKRGSGPAHILKLKEDGGVKDPEKLAALVLAKSGWRETRDAQRMRFLQIIVAHIKDIRDALETREQLMRSEDKGGLGMSPVESDAVLEAVREVMRLKPRNEVYRQAPLRQAQEPVKTQPDALKQASELLKAGALPPRPAPAPAPPERVEAAKPPPPPSPAAQIEKKELKETKLPASREEAIVMLTNEVMNELNFRLPDRYLSDRLRNAVTSRLREIRDWTETEETLNKPINAGGVGLSQQDIARVKNSLEPRVIKIQAELYRAQKEQVLEALQKERDGDRLREAKKIEAEKAELNQLFEQVTGRPAGGAASAEKIIKKEVVAAAPRPISKIAAAPESELVRASMVDVRPPTRLVGPIEELRRFNIIDFRKLSADPVEAVRKLQDKLKLLEAESLPKKLEGVAALKQSELFSLYFALSQTSLARGKPIEEVISDRASQNLPTLSKLEFDTLMEFNRALRY